MAAQNAAIYTNPLYFWIDTNIVRERCHESNVKKYPHLG
jgi:hypothetical protein